MQVPSNPSKRPPTRTSPRQASTASSQTTQKQKTQGYHIGTAHMGSRAMWQEAVPLSRSSAHIIWEDARARRDEAVKKIINKEAHHMRVPATQRVGRSIVASPLNEAGLVKYSIDIRRLLGCCCFARRPAWRSCVSQIQICLPLRAASLEQSKESTTIKAISNWGTQIGAPARASCLDGSADSGRCPPAVSIAHCTQHSGHTFCQRGLDMGLDMDNFFRK
jgi:hypothetical protein